MDQLNLLNQKIIEVDEIKTQLEIQTIKQSKEINAMESRLKKYEQEEYIRNSIKKTLSKEYDNLNLSEQLSSLQEIIKSQKEDFNKELEKANSLAHQYNLKNMTLIEEKDKLEKSFEKIKHFPLEFENLSKEMKKSQELISQKDFQIEDYKVKITSYLTKINELKVRGDNNKDKRKKLSLTIKELITENNNLKVEIEHFKIKEQESIEINFEYTKVRNELSNMKNELLIKERKILEVEKEREKIICGKKEEVKQLVLRNYERNSIYEEELILQNIKYNEKTQKILILNENLKNKTSEINDLQKKVEILDQVNQKVDELTIENIRLDKNLSSSNNELEDKKERIKILDLSLKKQI